MGVGHILSATLRGVRCAAGGTLQPRSHFRYIARIAYGGASELYLGEATGPADVIRPVALKRLSPQHAADIDQLRRFQDEARQGATLQHQNIVQTYDVLSVGNEHVHVQEYLDGSDLQRLRFRLANDRKVPVPFVLTIATGILQALRYAHTLHEVADGFPVVHRAISPDHIVLTRQGGVKLVSFGVVGPGRPAASDSNMLLGRVLYQAPEQCNEEPAEIRTDLYATTVVLYQLLTGNVPFRAGDAFRTMRAILDQEPPMPRLFNQEISKELDAVLLKGLAKDPEDRFQNATEYLQAIDEVATAEGHQRSGLDFNRWVDEALGPRRAMASQANPNDIDVLPAHAEGPVDEVAISDAALTIWLDGDPEQLEPFVGRIEALSEVATRIEVKGASVALAEVLSRSAPLRPRLRMGAVQVQTTCRDCAQVAEVTVPMSRVRGAANPRITQPCGQCGGALQVVAPLVDLRAASRDEATQTFSRAGCRPSWLA